MAVHPFGFHWRENLMNLMSFHFVKSTLQPDEPFFLGGGVWSQVCGDAKMTTALLDRVAHHYEIIKKTGNESWRLRQRTFSQ
jgi:hypothetical protein